VHLVKHLAAYGDDHDDFVQCFSTRHPTSAWGLQQQAGNFACSI